MSEQQDPKWIAAFITKFEKLQKDASTGTSAVVKALKDLGVLPLFPPFLAPRITPRKGFVSRWDRIAFRLAAGHLLSWESWCRRAAEEHTRRRKQVEDFETRYANLADQLAQLQRYEADRKAELERIALPMRDRAFLITGRMVRDWEDVRRKWQKTDRSLPALLEVLAEEQTRKRGRFGDPHLFRWLAQPQHHGLWADLRDGQDDPVLIVAHLNAMQRRLERSRETATMTLTDARLHPRNTQWEASRGTNLPRYTLRKTPTGGLQVTLPLLAALDGDRLAERKFDFALAPSGQFRDIDLMSEDGIRFRNDAREWFKGKLGSADLQFDRDRLPADDAEADDADMPRGTRAVARRRARPAYLKLAIDVEPQPPDGADPDFLLTAFHFMTSSGKRTGYEDKVRPGLRVLSVDLGLRSFAVASVFELCDHAPAGRLAFHVPDRGLWAVHERSFRLDMPGEDPGKRGREWREQATQELRRLRRTLGRHRRLISAAAAPVAERQEHIDALKEALGTEEGWPFEADLVRELEAALTLPGPLWQDLVRQLAGRFRDAFAEEVKA